MCAAPSLRLLPAPAPLSLPPRSPRVSPAAAGPIRARPKLLDQVRDAMRARHMSLRTEEAYVHRVFGREPGWREGLVRAKRPRRVAVVLTRPGAAG